MHTYYTYILYIHTIHSYIHTYTHTIHTYYTYIHTYIHTYYTYIHTCIRTIHTYTYYIVYIHTHTCIHTYYAYMYTYIHLFIFLNKLGDCVLSIQRIESISLSRPCPPSPERVRLLCSRPWHARRESVDGRPDTGHLQLHVRFKVLSHHTYTVNIICIMRGRW